LLVLLHGERRHVSEGGGAEQT